MESACQVKGCKVNKKSAAANKHVPHDENRPLNNVKENNNVSNCSEDEINEEIIVTTTTTNTTNNSRKQSSFKKNVKGSTTMTTTTPTNNNTITVTTNTIKSNTISNNASDKNNSSSSSSSNSISNNKVNDSKIVNSSSNKQQKVTTNDVSIINNKKVSNSTLAAADKPATTTTSGISYNKVAYSKVLSSNLPATTTTTTTIAATAATETTADKKASKQQSSSLTDESSNNEKQQQQQQQQQSVKLNQTSSTTMTTTTTTTTTTTSTKKSDPEFQQRRAVLSYEQVCRLNDVMNEVVSIHGRGNFPTLEVRLRDLVTVVKGKLEADPSIGGAGMKVRDIRLNGGAASHVLATESQPYNDLDLIFGVELSSGRNYDKVKAAVLGSLFDLLPEGVSRKRITTCSLKEAYVSKMVKVNNDGDRWSLISLGNSRGHRNVELKFVDTMRRQFEFSVDSFQIVLDSLLLFHETSKISMNENVYPTILGESVYGDFHEALYHLQKKLISTRHPEEIRGGGLLKYCNLLVKMYKAAQPDYIKTLERYMCSRFFIDFPDIVQQKAKLENYLWNHFVGPEEEALKYQYLMLLHSVVEESTVCLMGHERRQTLALIESLAYQVLCQEQQRLTNHQPQPTAYVYANGYYYAPVIPTACYTCTCNSWMACSS